MSQIADYPHNSSRSSGLSFLTLCLGAILLSGVGLAKTTAQEQDPVAILAYYSNQTQIEIFNSAGFRYEHYLGMALLPGDRVVNQDSSAEIEMLPSGTIMRIATGTEFVIESLQGRNNAPSTNVELVRGRVRSVTATVAGTRLQIRAGTVVGGVRGTDFIMQHIPGEQARLVVRSGLVELSNMDTGQSIAVSEGQAAEGLTEVLSAVELAPDILAEEFGELPFEQLDPEAVPRPEPEPEPEPQPGPVAPEPERPPVVETEDAPGAEFFERMTRYLGIEFGAVTIEGATYSRVVLEPRIELGRFRAGLYLPFVYQEDLFAPNEWYRPEGNNEWSFGTDYNWNNDTQAAVEDLARDLSLKLRYIEYGRRRDPFFIRAGNLRDITIGQGLLMNRYANDSDFPAVRRLGLNMGADTSYGGFEAMTNDVVGARISGVRLYMRPAAPAFRAALGFSAVADLYPGESLKPFEGATFDLIRDSDPVLLDLATDLEFPFIERDSISLIVYGEVGGLLPYLREDYGNPESGGLKKGLQDKVLFDWGEQELNNFGAAAGMSGHFYALDYRGEYRYSRGIFQHGVYNALYDRNRADRVRSIFAYMSDPDNELYDITTMGIYGEAGITFFRHLRVEAGYLWPWELDDNGNISRSNRDEALLRLAILPGWMPGGVHGSFSYRRLGFVPTLLERDGFEDADLLDHNTVLSGELVLPVAPAISFVAGLTTTVLRDRNGSIVYDSKSRPETRSSVSLETRIGY